MKRSLIFNAVSWVEATNKDSGRPKEQQQQDIFTKGLKVKGKKQCHWNPVTVEAKEVPQQELWF